MSKKVYARQVNPEFQGDFISDIFAYDEAFNNITVCGNDRLYCRQTEVFTRVYDALNSGDLAYYLDNMEDGYTPYTTVTEAINDYLYREDGKKYSCKPAGAPLDFTGNSYIKRRNIFNATDFAVFYYRRAAKAYSVASLYRYEALGKLFFIAVNRKFAGFVYDRIYFGLSYCTAVQLHRLSARSQSNGAV